MSDVLPWHTKKSKKRIASCVTVHTWQEPGVRGRMDGPKAMREHNGVRIMTKKHFILLADYVREARKYTDTEFTLLQIEHLANFCHAVNPRFNRDRWIGYISGTNGPCGGSVA